MDHMIVCCNATCAGKVKRLMCSKPEAHVVWPSLALIYMRNDFRIVVCRKLDLSQELGDEGELYDLLKKRQDVFCGRGRIEVSDLNCKCDVK